MHIPYTYLIGWSNYNKYYYGVRFAKNCNPNDLWKTYFTSSDKVKKSRLEFGEPDIIEVRKTFIDTKSARLWESKVLRKMNAVSDQRWLNQTDITDKFYHEGPRGKFSETHLKNMSIARKGRKISAEHAAALHAGRRDSKNSSEHNAILSANRKGHVKSAETLQKMSTSRKNHPRCNELALKAGRASAKKRMENKEEYSKIQSERMKLWWAERKERLEV